MRWWFIIIWGILLWLTLSWFAGSVGLKAEENDTAFTSNILPNAGTTKSSLSNSNLDGVQSGSTGALTNNSTHNGFTITCEVQVSNACGQAFNGELEASHDMTVKATGSLVGVEGDSTPDGVTHTSTQLMLNGGINLSSSIAVQNCEHNSSQYTCGNSTGAVDSYTLTMKVLDTNDNILATSTQTRTTDSGYNANERVWNDSLHYNGVHANKYEWSWTGVDGSQSTSTALLGTNLLGAEMALDFPTDNYEPLSAKEIKDMNEGLGTTNLSESEIWNVVSGIEESISEKLNIETGGAVVSVELTENFEIAVKTSKSASVKEVAKVKEVVQTMNKTKAVETLKKEVIAEVIKEAAKEEPKKEVKEESTVAAKPKEETTKKTKIETKENIKPELKVIMAKVDAKVKDHVKNLEIKNLIKMDRMTDGDISLVAYNNKQFYIPKDIYLNQLLIFDNRAIYKNVDLAKYIDNDIMQIKIKKLNNIKYQKNMLLLQIQELKNG